MDQNFFLKTYLNSSIAMENFKTTDFKTAGVYKDMYLCVYTYEYVEKLINLLTRIRNLIFK